MPIYEYRCENCKKTHEILQDITDEPITECPACHENSMKKMISVSSFKLTGTGWYETDFKNKSTSSSKSA